MLRLATCTLLLGLTTADLARSSEPQPKPPNIILVMADDLGWSDIGCYGGEIRTPHIDGLAKEGLRFTQFYNNAICGPTRASLLTGLYCQQVGHRGDHWNDPKDFNKCVTFAELLQKTGYRTMMVGKWQGRDSALDRGFDRFFGPMCQGKISYFHEVVQNPYYLNRERWKLPKDFYLTDALNEYAVKFLKEALPREEPFLLCVAHIAPHWPLHAHEDDIARNRNTYKEGWDVIRESRFARQQQLEVVPKKWKLSPRPSTVRDWEREQHKDWQTERMAVYAAQVEAIDRGLGTLLRMVDAAGERENTLVVFLSDNGAAPDGGLNPSTSGFGFGPKSKNDRWRLDGVSIRPGSGPKLLPGPHDTFAGYGLAWANASNAPLRGTKQTGYEGGIRTPLVVRWPAVIRKGGQFTNQVGHVIDILPTFVDVANTTYPDKWEDRRPLPVEGASLFPVFLGQQRPPHQTLCWSLPRHHAIRMGKWKGVRPKGKTWQLFDLEADGSETIDRAENEAEQVMLLANQFERWRKRVGAK